MGFCTSPYSQVVPDIANSMASLCIMFCSSVEDVSKAHTLIVNREQYKQAMQRRIQVCPVFENVRLDDEITNRDLPRNDVP